MYFLSLILRYDIASKLFIFQSVRAECFSTCPPNQICLLLTDTVLPVTTICYVRTMNETIHYIHHCGVVACKLRLILDIGGLIGTLHFIS